MKKHLPFEISKNGHAAPEIGNAELTNGDRTIICAQLQKVDDKVPIGNLKEMRLQSQRLYLHCFPVEICRKCVSSITFTSFSK